MWEILEELLNTVQFQMTEKTEKFYNALPRWTGLNLDTPRPQARSPIEMANSLGMEQVQPDAISGANAALDRMSAKLKQLDSLHSDEYKKANPEQFAQPDGQPLHVVVDNAKDIQPEPAEKTETPLPPRIEAMLDKLTSLQSPEFQALPQVEKDRRVAESERAAAAAGPTRDMFGRFVKARSPASPSDPVPLERWPFQTERSRDVDLITNPGRQSRPPKQSWTDRLFDSIRVGRGGTRRRVQGMLTRGGRAMQMGAGRLASVSRGPLMRTAASGMARMGMMMEGAGAMGTAGAAAVGTAAAVALPVAALAALAVGTYAAANAIHSMGESALEGQRKYAKLNGSIASTMAGVDIHNMMLQMKTGAETSGNTGELAGAMKALNEQLQPFESMAANVTMSIATPLVNGLAWLAENINAAVNEAKEWGIWLRRGDAAVMMHRMGQAFAQQNLNNNQPGVQMMNAMRGNGRQRPAQRPPLGPIP